MVDKKYYQDKIQDKVIQRNKAISRLITDIYAFVKDNEEVMAEINKIDAIIKAEDVESKDKPAIRPA